MDQLVLNDILNSDISLLPLIILRKWYLKYNIMGTQQKKTEN